MDVGWGIYNNLIYELIACDERLNKPSNVDPTMVKRVVARILLAADMDLANINSNLVTKILIDVLVEINKKEECWLVFVPISGPWGQYPLQRLKGEGSILRSNGNSIPFDLKVTDNVDLLLTNIFEHGVDNRVGAPTIDKFKGMRVRYLWRGYNPLHGDDSINGIYNRFASIVCLWIKDLFNPLAAIEYPLSLMPSSTARFYGHIPSMPQEFNSVAKPHDVILERGKFGNLWEFIEWFNCSFKRLPKPDIDSLMLALNANRSAYFATSTAMFLIQSEILAESLLGEERELSRTIAQRAAWTLGYERDKSFRQEVYEEEKKLYALRSKLVHGRFGESDLGNEADMETYRQKIDKRNREIILRALEIERSEELKVWADRNILA